MPRALQYVEQELVQDGLGAARTLDDHAGGSGGVQRGGVGPTCTHDHRGCRARHSVGTWMEIERKLEKWSQQHAAAVSAAR